MQALQTAVYLQSLLLKPKTSLGSKGPPQAHRGGRIHVVRAVDKLNSSPQPFDPPEQLPVVEIVTRDGVITRNKASAKPRSAEPAAPKTTAKPPSTEPAATSLYAAEDKREWAKKRLAELKKKGGAIAEKSPEGLGVTAPPASPTESAAGDSGGGFGAQIAALMVSRRQEPSRYANLVQPLEKPKGDLPEIEVITRDGREKAAADDEKEMYKPKVSTWGVFPRPQNISETYGGGRTIRPGDKLITEEEEKEKAARTAKLLEEFNVKAGLSMDPQIKQAVQASLTKGLRLMDAGSLLDAIGHFDEVMKGCVYRTEEYGEACLQKAVCLDSLGRHKEAKQFYEKLGRHPNTVFRKKANQMLFGFVAAESLKVESREWHDVGVYSRYFNRFSDGYGSMWSPTEGDTDTGPTVQELLPYMLLFAAPILLVVVLAATRS